MRRVRVTPTLFTLANLVSGFGSITMSIHAITATAGTLDPLLRHQQNENYQVMAVWLIALAMVFDLLDGRVARMTGLTSRFGAELDSLADMVSFGLAPAVLAIVLLSANDWPMPLQRAGWGMLALYAAAAAVRLARYNVESINAESGGVTSKSKGSEYFTGLPSPAAAGMAVSPVLLYQWILDQGVDEAATRKVFAAILPVLMLGLAWLMISRVRYLHIGNWMSARRQKLVWVMALIAVLILAASFRHHVPVMAIGTYVVGGLIWDLGRRMANARARRRPRPPAAEGGAVSPSGSSGPAGS